MRLISESEHYQCMNCGQYLLSSMLLPYIGFFVVSLGIFLLFFTLIVDKIGFGRPGIGPIESFALVFSAIFIILGLFIVYNSKW